MQSSKWIRIYRFIRNIWVKIGLLDYSPAGVAAYCRMMMMMSCDVGSLPDAFELSDATPLLRASEQGLEKTKLSVENESGHC